MFLSNTLGTLTCWNGSPSCQAAHDLLLKALESMVAGQFLAVGTTLNSRVKGNLAEFCAFTIGRAGPLREYNHVVAMNAYQPLSNISKPGVDLVHLLFDDSNPANDRALLQEVKATSDVTLGYAATLVDDYLKLFGVEPCLTLQSRLQYIKNLLEYQHGRPDLCPRVNTLAGQAAHFSTGVRLLPTLVYEKAVPPQVAPVRMAAVRTSLLGEGWSPSQVNEWAISLTDLEDRFTRLSWGQQ